MNTENLPEHEKKLAAFWLLITSLNATKFALGELEIERFKQERKMRFRALQQATNTFLGYLPKESEVADMAFENVSAMVEVMSIIAQMPPTQIEWYLQEVKKLSYIAINRALAEEAAI